MKYAIVSPDKQGRIDPPINRILLNFPNLTTQEEADILLIPITKLDNFEFNRELFRNSKPYIIFDYCEYGWDWDRKETHLFGKNTLDFEWFCNPDQISQWMMLDTFINIVHPLAYFKRELLKKEEQENVFPIDYPCYFDKPITQTVEEFNDRPISVFNYWGRSHEARLIYHGEVWKNAARKGYAVCDNIYQFNKFMELEANPNKWVTLHQPWYDRVDLSEIMIINGMSKLSLSMWGAGVKCFRSTGEAPVNSVVVMPEDELAWSYDWIDNDNCIKFFTSDIKGIDEEFPVIQKMEYALQRLDLYNIYINGLETVDKYRIDRYINEYIIPKIEL